MIEKVTAIAQPVQSYALYLPSNYTAQKKWPILFAFDPSADGKIPVDKFREAAEKYGYIVVGSNNSQNGPFAPELAAFKAMWEDTHARLAIDDRRVYFTGFSGGARVATSIALLCKNCAAGIIACGAGFPASQDPAKPLPFAYFSTIGLYDFNFFEVKDLHDKLERLQTPHRLSIFPGRHEWLPKELAVEAIEWMELRAMASGLRPKDEAFIETKWQQGMQRAQKPANEKDVAAEYEAYKHLAADFRGLRDVGDVEKQAQSLEKSPEVRAAAKKLSDQERMQQQLTGELIAKMETLKDDPGNLVDRLQELHGRLAQLKSQRDKEKDPDTVTVLRRSLGSLYVYAWENADRMRERRNFSLAATYLELNTEITPDNPELYYNLAAIGSLARDKKKALSALRKAMDHGYQDMARLNTDPDLEFVRQTPEFKSLTAHQ
ncbi:MAG TPA: hypothetical protein VEG30_00470 [Terriglobales bacterium]|nr:hypothetical protein [Terriglobales bacterium]